jgi:hypothetical protein
MPFRYLHCRQNVRILQVTVQHLAGQFTAAPAEPSPEIFRDLVTVRRYDTMSRVVQFPAGAFHASQFEAFERQAELVILSVSQNCCDL